MSTVRAAAVAIGRSGLGKKGKKKLVAVRTASWGPARGPQQPSPPHSSSSSRSARGTGPGMGALARGAEQRMVVAAPTSPARGVRICLGHGEGGRKEKREE